MNRLILAAAVIGMAALVAHEGLKSQPQSSALQLANIQTDSAQTFNVTDAHKGVPNITYAALLPEQMKQLGQWLRDHLFAAQHKERPRPPRIAAQHKEHPCWPFNCEKLDQKLIVMQRVGD